MTLDPKIRQAHPDDAAALALVGAATFLESYSGFIPGPDLVAHCRERHAEAVYAGWIADPGSGVWLVEAAAGAPLGYAVVTTPDMPEDCTADGDLELRRIYLMQMVQGGGTGPALMRAALEGAAALGAARLTVGVHGGNAGAIGFYRRMGFEKIGRRVFTVGEQRYDDLVLARAV